MRGELSRHIEEYKAAFMNNEFYMDKNNSQMVNIEKSHEQLKEYVDGRFE